MTDPPNPFERFGLDPLEGPRALTERLRELAEDATSEAERDLIRAAWDELTMHPARRLRAALAAAPETRPPLGSAPRAPASAEAKLDIADLLPLPSVSAALPASRGEAPVPLPSLAEDPVLARIASRQAPRKP